MVSPLREFAIELGNIADEVLDDPDYYKKSPDRKEAIADGQPEEELANIYGEQWYALEDDIVGRLEDFLRKNKAYIMYLYKRDGAGKLMDDTYDETLQWRDDLKIPVDPRDSSPENQKKLEEVW
jgi:hypothetical protein